MKNHKRIDGYIIAPNEWRLENVNVENVKVN